MALTSGFFPSVNGDRKQTGSFLAQWIHSLVSNGVYDGDFAITAGANMNVILPTGQAWINGYYCRNDGDVTLPIANADGILKRKDTVVLRWDINTRDITAQVLTGAFASNPVAPAIVRTVEQYDLKLAEIYVAAGTTAITQAMITDTRLDNAVCGLVTQMIKMIDTTALYNQIQADLVEFKSVNEADFTAWLAGIKDTLGVDVVGNLLNLINDHKADTAAHVTQAKQDKWDAGVVSTYIHTKSGIVHNLAGTGKNIEFLPTAGIADGDTWTVNGTSVTAKLQNGDPLPADLFKAGSWVTGVRLDGAKLNFKWGAGSIKDMYDFPLSIQTDAPTPVNTNHIWIQNASKMTFVMDEAVRANYNDYYCAKIDSTNNKYMNLVTTKKTTDGAKITVFDNYINRDNIPWTTASNVPFAPGSSLAVGSKFPMIYSKFNGVVDMETAYRWDGSAWQYLSQKGHYLHICTASGVYKMFNLIGATLVEHPAPLPQSGTNSNCCEFTKDSNYVFIAIMQVIYCFKRSGDNFTQTTFNNYRVDATMCLSSSPDGNYLAVGYAATVAVGIYKKQTDGTWASIVELNTANGLARPIRAICWKDDSNYFAVGDAYGNIYYIKRVGDTFTNLGGYNVYTNATASAIISLSWVGSQLFYRFNSSTNGAGMMVMPGDVSSSPVASAVAIPGSGCQGCKMISGNRAITIRSGYLYLLQCINGVTSSLSTLVLPGAYTVSTFAVSFDEKYVYVHMADNNLYVYALNSNNTFTLINTYPVGIAPSSAQAYSMTAI